MRGLVTNIDNCNSANALNNRRAFDKAPELRGNVSCRVEEKEPGCRKGSIRTSILPVFTEKIHCTLPDHLLSF